MIKKILNNLYKVEVPIPNNPLKALNSYVIEGRERNLIIDTGMNRREALEVLETALKRLDIDLASTDFFITHLHTDHSGLVSQLATATSKVYCSLVDSDVINLGKDQGHWSIMRDFLACNGFPPQQLDMTIENHPGYKYCTDGPIDFTIVDEKFQIEVGEYTFQCIETPGHTKGHICLFEPHKKLLIAGDHLLNDITPNISLFNKEDNPLKEYLESLEKISHLDISLVLPGHRRIFEDHLGRIKELKSHHQLRAQEVIAILQLEAISAFQVASHMTWSLTYKSWEDFPVQQKWFATGEALAHLKYLEEKGQVVKVTKNGINIYST